MPTSSFEHLPLRYLLFYHRRIRGSEGIRYKTRAWNEAEAEEQLATNGRKADVPSEHLEQQEYLRFVPKRPPVIN